MKKIVLLLFTILVFTNCSDNPESFIKHIEGYWEIKHVEKDNILLKEYTVNANIDYFKIDQNTLTGYRKKVTPTFEGKYIVNKHKIPFVLKIEDNYLNINYTSKSDTYRERVVAATKDKLVIENTEGIIYVYRPFTPIDISHE
ncbi:MAG: hypothetical protein KJN82_01895 [Bacteroidia bacterium]|nr:hypothetical protein [Bacteroidia bacterium]